jgi:hypothetical protein
MNIRHLVKAMIRAAIFVITIAGTGKLMELFCEFLWKQYRVDGGLIFLGFLIFICTTALLYPMDTQWTPKED